MTPQRKREGLCRSAARGATTTLFLLGRAQLYTRVLRQLSRKNGVVGGPRPFSTRTLVCPLLQPTRQQKYERCLPVNANLVAGIRALVVGIHLCWGESCWQRVQNGILSTRIGAT